jgi:hypothetical protein
MTTRHLFYALAMGAAIFSTSCEKEEDPATNNNNGNGNGNGNNNITNNTLQVGADSGPVNMYSAYQPTDANTGNKYFTLFVYLDNAGSSPQWLELALNEIPMANKTLQWQDGTNAPGDLKQDEFSFRMKMAGEDWTGVFTSTGWETTGTLEARVSGNKLEFSFSDIELADSPIAPRVNVREKASGKFTVNLDDLQDLQAGPTAFYDLLD